MEISHFFQPQKSIVYKHLFILYGGCYGSSETGGKVNSDKARKRNKTSTKETRAHSYCYMDILYSTVNY